MSNRYQQDRPTALSASMDARSGVVAVLRLYWADAFAQRHKVHNPRWIEPVHAMRVDTRRLRTCLKFFGTCLDGRLLEEVAAPLHGLNCLLAPVRDGDVLCKWIRSVIRKTEHNRLVDPLAAFERHLRQVQQPHRQALVSWIEAGNLVVVDASLNHADELLARGIDPGCGKPLGKAVRKSIRKQARRIAGDIDALPARPEPVTLHQLRRKVRRLRYTLQAFMPLYDGEAASLVKQLIRFQDVLGDHQDCIVHRQAIDAYRQSLEAGGELDDLQQEALIGLDRSCACSTDGFYKKVERELTGLKRALSKKRLAFLEGK